MSIPLFANKRINDNHFDKITNNFANFARLGNITPFNPPPRQCSVEKKLFHQNYMNYEGGGWTPHIDLGPPWAPQSHKAGAATDYQYAII